MPRKKFSALLKRGDSFWLRCIPLLQAVNVSEEVVHVVLRKLGQKIAMRGERIANFYFHAAALERTVPARFVSDTKRNDKVIDVRKDAGNLFSASESNREKDRLVVRIKHVRFELDG